MKRLSKAQTSQLEDTLADLEEAQEGLNEAVDGFNAASEEAWNKLQAALEEFNASRSEAWGKVDSARDAAQGILEDLEAIREEVASDQESYFDGRTEKWQEGDAGSLYSEWKDKWSDAVEIDLSDYESEPDPLEIDPPEEMDRAEDAWTDLVAEAYTLDPDGDTASPSARAAKPGQPEKPVAVGKMSEAEQKTLAHIQAKPVCPRCESPDDVCAEDPDGEKFCAGCFHAWGPNAEPLDGINIFTDLPLVCEFLVTIEEPSDGYVTGCARHARDLARDQGGTLTGETRACRGGYCPLCPEEAP